MKTKKKKQVKRKRGAIRKEKNKRTYLCAKFINESF